MTEPLGPGDPRRVAEYQLLGRLGQGGMGRVYLGRSRGGRLVAVRVVAPGLGTDAEFRRHFADEVAAARAVGGFYAAPVVDADVESTPPWLVTEYVPGPTLEQAVRVHGALPGEAARVLGAGLAEGLAAIHARGVLHRDLKPGNVILGHGGPRLIDFGISRALDAAHLSTRALGAVGFMAPEQIRGTRVAEASDVFSLGAVLAFAATGRRPFGAGPASEVVDRIVDGEPDLTGISGPLLEIVAACLAKQPTARPAVSAILRGLSMTFASTAGWLPPELDSMVTWDEQQTQTMLDADVTPDGTVTLGPLRLRRRSLLIGGIGALAAAVAVPVGISLASGSSDSGRGRTTGTGQGAGAGATYVPFATLAVAKSEVEVTMVFSPDGKTMAVSLGTSVALWDMATRKQIATLPLDSSAGVRGLAYSHDGTKLAAGFTASQGLDLDIGGVTVWDAASHEQIATMTTPSQGTVGLFTTMCIAIRPDGRHLAAGRDSKTSVGLIPIWDLSSRQLVHNLVVGAGKETDVSSVQCVAYSPDGRYLAAGWGIDNGTSGVGGIELWDASTYRHIGSIALDATYALGVLGLAFTPDSKSLIGVYGGVAVWDVASRSLTATISPFSATNTSIPDYQSMAVSPDGKTVAATWGARSNGGQVTLWDLASRKKIVSLAAGRNGAGAVAFSPDGTTLAAEVDDAAMNPTVQLWRTA